jgi:hypothetical protein
MTILSKLKEIDEKPTSLGEFLEYAKDIVFIFTNHIEKFDNTDISSVALDTPIYADVESAVEEIHILDKMRNMILNARVEK